MINFDYSNGNKPEDVVEAKGHILTKTMGTSMRPFIVTGRDTVHIVKNKARLKKYDVAFYKRGNLYILHRVLRVHNGCYDIVGDNHIKLEKGIKDSQIIGVMDGYYKGEKYIACNSFSYKLKTRIYCFLPVKLVFIFCNRVKIKLKRLFKRLIKLLFMR